MVSWLKFCLWSFQRQLILAPAARAVAKRVRGRVPFFIEAMEERRMLTSTCNGAAAFTFTGDGTGTTITASTTSGTLTVADSTKSCSFAQSSVTSLSIDGGDGTDTITVQTSVLSSIPVTLQGGNDNDVITGGNGGDTILGGSGNDQLFGGSGNDSIDGGTNDDVIQGDDGTDTLVGGTGVNTVSYQSSMNGINITLDGTVNDTDGFGNTDNIGTQFRHVVGGNGADFISGNSDDNKLEGGAGNDTLRGSGGTGADGADSLYGGNDAGDLADFSLRTDSIKVNLDDVSNDGNQGSSEGDDVRCHYVTTGSGNDTIIGDSSGDQLIGGTGADSIVGGTANDTIDGGAGNDILSGLAGADSISGGADNDNITGNTGDDWIEGGAGTDTESGNEDQDTFFCGTAADGNNDSLFGGSGIDFADFSQRTNAVNVTIGTGVNDGESGENDSVGSDVENVTSGSGGDSLVGNGSNNVLIGGSGNDRLEGGAGADTLYGEGGDDILYDNTSTGSDTDSDLLDGGSNGAGGDTLGGSGATDTTLNFEH